MPTSAAIIDKWFVILAMLPTASGREPHPMVLEAWHLVFGKYAPEELEHAFARAYTECKFFPAPADVISRIPAQENASLKAVAAEDEWVRVKELSEFYDHDAGGWVNPKGSKGFAELSDPAKHAIRVVGGIFRIRMCPMNSLGFMKQEFLSAYANGEEKQRLGLGDGDARRLLDVVKEKAKLLLGAAK